MARTQSLPYQPVPRIDMAPVKPDKHSHRAQRAAGRVSLHHSVSLGARCLALINRERRLPRQWVAGVFAWLAIAALTFAVLYTVADCARCLRPVMQ